MYKDLEDLMGRNWELQEVTEVIFSGDNQCGNKLWGGKKKPS
jgi:hypothetical protein